MSEANLTKIFTTTAVEDVTEISDGSNGSGIGTILSILLVSTFFTNIIALKFWKGFLYFQLTKIHINLSVKKRNEEC